MLATDIELIVFTTTATAPGRIPSGGVQLGVLNSGANPGTFNGQPLPAGASVNLSAPAISADGIRHILPRLEYDATGTTFIITATFYQR